MSSSAPRYDVPEERIVSIEHPCIVKNFDNGFKSLGGEHQLKHVFEHEIGESRKSLRRVKYHEPVAGVSLRPNDLFAKKISSIALETQNILLKLTLPKRTGRKRKRGSDEPFAEDVQHAKAGADVTAPQLLNRLRENSDNYTLHVVGTIYDTHRFRDLPDLQVRAEDVPIMRELRDHAMHPSYDKLKNFHVDLQPGCAKLTAFPGPPSFFHVQQPYSYEFQEADIEYGKRSSKAVNGNDGPRTRAKGLFIDEEQTRESPPEREPPSAKVANTISALKSLLEERPIVTFTAASSILKYDRVLISKAVEHVGYVIESGPWKDSIVGFGVDPTTDPKYRIYQTIEYDCPNRRAFKAPRGQEGEAARSHIFDGSIRVEAARTWQLCDMTDPLLRDLVDTDELRQECDDEDWGWYHNGTIAKIRVLFQHKLDCVLGKESFLTEDTYGYLAALPSRIEPDAESQPPPSVQGRVRELMVDIRRKANYSGPKRRKSRRGASVETNGEAEGEVESPITRLETEVRAEEGDAY